MQKLFRLTPLQDSFPCNFNILIAGMPRVMGVRGDSGGVDGLAHASASSAGSIFQLQKKKEKLHLLKGLERILLDIDKAIRHHPGDGAGSTRSCPT